VTGGAGFIGANWLLRMVPRHPDIRFINLDALTYAGNLMSIKTIESAPNYRFVHGDITDASLVTELIARNEVDGVVHFAAESHVDRSIRDASAFIRTNVTGTHVLLEAARRSWEHRTPGSVRFHHISTDEVFGTLGPTGHFTEETSYAPRSPYAASKASADHLVRSYGVTYGLPFVLTNTSNNYGPRQFPEKLIPLVISRAVAGESIPVYGKGEQVRDWLHVDDHCAALEAVLLEGKVGETYLIGGNEEARNIDLVTLLLRVVDEHLGQSPGTSAARIQFVKDRPGHDFRYALDSTKIRSALGWTPQYDLISGLRQTVSWYMDNPDWMDAVRDERYRSYIDEHYRNAAEQQT
jgi:dTDP-glucose 4,6-dehydratase